MYMNPRLRQTMLDSTSKSVQEKVKSSIDRFWVVLEDSKGFDLTSYDFYEMIDCLNKGELYERVYWVYDNWYDARWHLDELIAETEANV